MQRERITNFLNSELNAVTENFGKKFSAPALHLLYEAEEMFVGQFLKFENGEMIVRFKTGGGLPRKGEYLDAFYLPLSLQSASSWRGKSYEDLYKQRIKGSEAICIWQTKGQEAETVVMGFRGIELPFAEYLKEASGALIFFGPHRPPIEYLCNLYRLIKNDNSDKVCDILDYAYSPVTNTPILIKTEKPEEFIYRQIASAPITVLQGPPGTGKTHLISSLCAKFCEEGKSVLVTALTNRALIEVASKSACENLLNQGKVFKGNLTYDEKQEVAKLNTLPTLSPVKGSLILATYYMVSGFTENLVEGNLFDIVIMDEASQALLPMFAAAYKIGKKSLWVGDTAQLGPVVSVREDWMKNKNYQDFADGFATLTHKRPFPVYQLTKTYRLPSRGAEYTGLFYRGSLVSGSNSSVLDINSLKSFIKSEGGPTLLLTDMPISDPSPNYAIDMATFIVHSILQECPGADIAVLTFLRKTVRSLQKAISLRLGLGNKVVIDTVSRVQGLTTDVTLFFIPNTSLIRSLESRLFNVATSRAKSHTVIIAPKEILKFPYMNEEVRNFLERLNKEGAKYIPELSNVAGRL
ncbi:MAG: AAA family ATPase [Muribaculaceae bacterium]|nr:AAA family ATPase [Muribaculaceae bacterium]